MQLISENVLLTKLSYNIHGTHKKDLELNGVNGLIFKFMFEKLLN